MLSSPVLADGGFEAANEGGTCETELQHGSKAADPAAKQCLSLRLTKNNLLPAGEGSGICNLQEARERASGCSRAAAASRETKTKRGRHESES